MILVHLLASFLVLLAAASPHLGTTISYISANQTVNIGERAQLDCTVNSGGHYSVLWLQVDTNTQETPFVIFNGSSLLTQNARFSAIVDTATSTYRLLIQDIQETDAGQYQCQVITSQNESITREVQIQVHKPPVFLNNLTDTLTPMQGEPVTLECYASGYPPPKISWRRENNIPLPSGAVIYRGNILKIHTIRKEDRGVYYCVADNGVGKPIKHSVEVNVEFGPIVNVNSHIIGQALQYEADIECTVDGYPDPSISWIRNGTVLQSNNKYAIAYFSMRAGHSSSVLRITKVQPDDYGFYICKASNKIGRCFVRVELVETEDPVCPPACNARLLMNITGTANITANRE